MNTKSPVKVWRNQKKTRDLLGQRGKIVSWTLIRVPPSSFESQAPYPVALIELETGRRITCQLVDWEEEHVQHNQLIQLIVRRVTETNTEGIIPYGIKAIPL